MSCYFRCQEYWVNYLMVRKVHIQIVCFMHTLWSLVYKCGETNWVLFYYCGCLLTLMVILCNYRCICLFALKGYVLRMYVHKKPTKQYFTFLAKRFNNKNGFFIRNSLPCTTTLLQKRQIEHLNIRTFNHNISYLVINNYNPYNWNMYGS